MVRAQRRGEGMQHRATGCAIGSAEQSPRGQEQLPLAASPPCSKILALAVSRWRWTHPKTTRAYFPEVVRSIELEGGHKARNNRWLTVCPTLDSEVSCLLVDVHCQPAREEHVRRQGGTRTTFPTTGLGSRFSPPARAGKARDQRRHEHQGLRDVRRDVTTDHHQRQHPHPLGKSLRTAGARGTAVLKSPPPSLAFAPAVDAGACPDFH